MKTIICCCFAAGVNVGMLELVSWRVKLMPTKEEERFGAELALKCRSRWDRPFLMFQSCRSSSPLRLI